MSTMFTDRHDRRDWLIGLVLTAITFAGVYWLRGRPVDRPTLSSQATQAARDTAVFKLTQPLPQARDGVRDVMTTVNECRDARGQRIFSDRPCGSGAVAEGSPE